MVKSRSDSPEGFESNEKFKLSLINMEKRFVDLEMAVSELDQKVKSGNVESIKEINERLDEIEDLMLVEQAGLMELKKLMERAEDRFQTAIKFDEKFESKFDDRLSVFERKISDIKRMVEEAKEISEKAKKEAEEPDVLTEEAKKRIELIEKDIAKLKTKPAPEPISPLEIGELRNKFKSLDKKMSLLKNSFGNLKASVDAQIRQTVEEELRGKTGQGMDFEFIKTKLDSLKERVSNLSNKRSETELKLGEIEQRIDSLDSKVRGLPAKTVDEIKDAKSGLETVKLRIESVERVIRELTDNMNELEKKANSFESLERLTNLREEVDDKLRRFKKTEKEVNKLSRRIEVIYNDLDKRMAKFKGMEKDIERLSKSQKEFLKDFEQVRIDMNNRVKKKDLGKIRTMVRENTEYVDDIGKLTKNIDERIRSLESDGSFKEVRNNIKSLEGEVEKLKKDVGSVESGDGMPQELKDVIVDFGMRISEIENTLDLTQTTLTQLSERAQAPSAYDMQLEELVNKFLLLESRLSALEKSARKTQPIILE